MESWAKVVQITHISEVNVHQIGHNSRSIALKAPKQFSVHQIKVVAPHMDRVKFIHHMKLSKPPLAHQQQQRGVSQLTNAVATLGHPPRNTQTPTPSGQPGMNGGGSQQGIEKRGPVEFNHAISYVNKIKVSIGELKFGLRFGTYLGPG
jgi:histone deacetylase complex regulatory component SIN3